MEDCFSILSCTDKKENKIFLIYKEIQKGSVAKSSMTNGFLIWLNICAFPQVLGSPSSYMTLQLIPSYFFSSYHSAIFKRMDTV